MRVGIALGSNLGDRLAHLRAARSRVLALPGASPPAVDSRVYETEPVAGGPESGPYLNAVTEVEYDGQPITLLDGLQHIEAEMGRPPTDQEIAKKLGMPIDEFERMKSEASAVNLVSLNKKWYETDSYKDVREIDIIEDTKGEDPTRGIQKRDLMKLVTKGLNRNERLIIILYYYEELTMKEIGATLDLSESRVSQMHSAIVQRLQGQLGKRRPEFGQTA